MNHYEPRGGLAHGDGLKAFHILPFVSNFTLMLEQLTSFQDTSSHADGSDEPGDPAADIQKQVLINVLIACTRIKDSDQHKSPKPRKGWHWRA